MCRVWTNGFIIKINHVEAESYRVASVFIGQVYSHIYYHAVNYPHVKCALEIDFLRCTPQWYSAKQPWSTIKRCVTSAPTAQEIGSILLCLVLVTPWALRPHVLHVWWMKARGENRYRLHIVTGTRRWGFALNCGIAAVMLEGASAFIAAFKHVQTSNLVVESVFKSLFYIDIFILNHFKHLLYSSIHVGIVPGLPLMVSSFSRLLDWPVSFKSSSVQLPSGDTRYRAHTHLCCCLFASVMIRCFTHKVTESVTLHTDTLHCSDVDPETLTLLLSVWASCFFSSDVTFTYYSTSYLITHLLCVSFPVLLVVVFLMRVFFFSFIALWFPNLLWLSVDIYILSTNVWNKWWFKKNHMTKKCLK